MFQEKKFKRVFKFLYLKKLGLKVTIPLWPPTPRNRNVLCWAANPKKNNPMFLHNALSGTVVIGCRLANELPMVYRPVERRCWFVVSHSIGRKLRLVSSKGAKDICRDGVNRFHLRLPRAGILLAGIVQQWNLVTYETSSCTWVGFPHF